MILVIIFLLCVLVITSLLESSYSSLNIIRIKKLMENKNKKAKMVYKLYSKYSEAITSILVVNCVCSVMVSSLTTYYFSNLYGDGSVTLVTIILTLIVLIFRSGGNETSISIKNYNVYSYSNKQDNF